MLAEYLITECGVWVGTSSAQDANDDITWKRKTNRIVCNHRFENGLDTVEWTRYKGHCHRSIFDFDSVNSVRRQLLVLEYVMTWRLQLQLNPNTIRELLFIYVENFANSCQRRAALTDVSMKNSCACPNFVDLTESEREKFLICRRFQFFMIWE